MIDHFSFFAPIYERVIPPPEINQLQELLLLPARGRLLDAGGGTGRVSSGLSHLVDELVLSDSSRGMLAQAQAKADLHIVQSHSERLPFKGASFDRILVVDALHHFRDQRLAIANLIRVLKAGGRIVIEEPNIDFFRVKLIALAEKLMLMQSHFLTPVQIREELHRLGLSAHIKDDHQFSALIIGDKIA